MDLKVTEGIIRTTQYRFMKKNFKKIDQFAAKNRKFPKAIQYGEKKEPKTATAGDVQILA